MSPPGGILLRKAPGTAALDFGQLIPLSTAWQQDPVSLAAGHVPQPGSPAAALAAGAAAQRRTSVQGGGGGRLSPQPARQAVAGLGVRVWDEATAWVCNMPDPIAASEYVLR